MSPDAPGASPAADARIGTTLGGYRIDGVAGRGGMGVVYRAWDPSLDRPVALKLLPTALSDDEAFRARFLRETRLAAAIDHPNIIPIYEAGEDAGVLFLAMRLVDGVDLDRRLAAGPLDVGETVDLLRPVAEALDVAHAGGLVHRDVKPANILVGDTPMGGHAVYLTDFGLTKQRESQSGLTRTGSLLGTVEYMAPEQIEGRPINGATDQYALAGTAYRCLTGHVPFERETAIASALAHLKEPSPRVSQFRPDVPPAVDAVIARGMAKLPTERFATCGDMIVALEHAGIVARTTGAAARAPTPARVVVAIGLAVMGVIGGLLLVSRGGTPTAAPSPPAAAIASNPSATSTQTVAPSATAFPTAAEQRLLDTLPAALRATCVRGAGQADLRAAGFSGTVTGSRSGSGPSFVNNVFNVMPPPAQASIACHPGAGPNGAWFLWYALGGGADPESTAQVAVADISTHLEVPAGDCTAPPAEGSWRSLVGGSGTVMCLKDTGPGGQPWIYWSFGTAHVLGVATAPAGQYQALYDWWQALTPFLD